MDEAGYGPLLGPLVVAQARRAGGGDEDLWRALEATVASRPTRGDERLLVCDSKLAYTTGRLQRLELTVLAVLCLEDGRVPADLDELEAALAGEGLDCPDDLHGRGGRRDTLPWQDRPPALPLSISVDRVRAAADALRRAMDATGVRSLRPVARAVQPEAFNRAVDRLGNKADVLAETAAPYLAWAPPGSHTVCDRWGGRRDYRAVLTAIHGGPQACDVVETERRRGASRYRIRRADGERAVAFLQGAESRCFEAALASMTAKYLREVHMRAFNDWWKERAPALRPTAGYPEDAKRWLREAGPPLRRAGIDRALLVRKR